MTVKHNTTTQYSASKIIIYNNQTLIASIYVYGSFLTPVFMGLVHGPWTWAWFKTPVFAARIRHVSAACGHG